MRRLENAVSAALLSATAAAPASAADTPAAPKPAIVNPPSLYDPAPYGYSHAVLVEGAVRLVYIAGQGGEHRDGSLSPHFAEQVAQAYSNLGTALAAVGASPDRVVKLATYVVDHDEAKLEILTRALTGLFGNHLPAQTLVPVPRLALDGMLFEVDAVAVLE